MGLSPDKRELPVVPRKGVATGSGILQVVENNNFVAAGPVSRILSAGLLPQDGHSSGPRITARL